MDPSNFMNLTSARASDDARGTHALPTRASAGGAAPHPGELIGRPCQPDPTLAALMVLVSAQRAEAEAWQREELEGTAVGWSAEEVDELTDRLDESVREVRRLSAQLDSARSELQMLHDRADRLADALGACASCWGEDSACPECQGRGRPGRSMPDERLFADIVMPAVELMRLCERRPPPTNSEPIGSRSPNEQTLVNLYAKALIDRGTRNR
jgi:hypothetical protein